MNPLAEKVGSLPVLDFQSGRPLQEQIADYFRRQILEGVIQAGHQLPLCPELGRLIGVTGRTVDRAYNRLATEGLLYRRRALGTIVGAPSRTSSVAPAAFSMHRTKAPLPPVCLAMTRYPNLVLDHAGHPDDRGLNASLLSDYVNGLMEGFASLRCRFEIALADSDEGLLNFVHSLIEHGQTRSFVNLGMDAETLDYLVDRGVPVVALNDDLSGRGIASVKADDVHAYREAWEHADRLGHSHAAFLGVARSGEDAPTMPHYRACAAALSLLGLPLRLAPPVVPTHGDDSAAIWKALVARFGAFRPEGDWPTLLFTHNDMIAVRLIGALSDHGIQVPRDVSVIGFDDATAVQGFRPALTTLRKPRFAMALAASRLMLDVLADHPGSAGRLQVFPMHLVERETVGAPRRRGQAARADKG